MQIGGVTRDQIKGPFAVPEEQGAMIQPLELPQSGMFGARKKKKFGIGDAIAHALMGAAAGMGNTAPYQAYMARRQREEEQLLAQQQAARAAGQRVEDRNAAREEWLWKKQWERNNPDNQLAEYMRMGGIDPNSEEAQGLYRQAAENMALAPPMVVNNPDGTRTIYPSGSIPRPSSGPPAAAIEYLKKNPQAADQFEAKYGKGSAARYLGGSGGNAGGGFR